MTFFNKLSDLFIENEDIHLYANMDETRIERDMPSNQTVEIKGAKEVPVKTHNCERIAYTIILCALSNVSNSHL